MITFPIQMDQNGNYMGPKPKELRTFKIVDGYCVDESGMRVGRFVQDQIEFGPDRNNHIARFPGVNNVLFFDDRYYQNAGQCCLRLTGDPIANIEI